MTRRTLFAGAALLTLATPAIAHHPGASGVGQGASLDVMGPDTLASGQAAAGIRVILSIPDSRSDAALADLAGRHIHAHDSDYDLNAGLGLAYGLSNRLTVSVELPYVRHDDLRAGSHSHSGGSVHSGVEELGTVDGVGDASLLAKYRLTGDEGPGVALIAGVKVPTGATHRESRDGERLETEHQPGSGSWDPIIGAAFGTHAGPVRINTSALYQISGKGAHWC